MSFEGFALTAFRRIRSSSPGFLCLIRSSAARTFPRSTRTSCLGWYGSIRTASSPINQFARELEVLGPLPDASGPPHLAFAVGGAGAQAEMSGRFLPSLRELLLTERLRLTLVAGTKREVRDLFELELERSRLAKELGRSIRILYEPNVDEYFDRFDALLAGVDILWTKPSELTFYAALGLALVFAPPIGVQEDYNQRWALENGAGLRQRDPTVATDWLSEWLSDGTLAAVAWASHKRLPCRGLYRILERLGFPAEDASRAHPRSTNGTTETAS